MTACPLLDCIPFQSQAHPKHVGRLDASQLSFLLYGGRLQAGEGRHVLRHFKIATGGVHHSKCNKDRRKALRYYCTSCTSCICAQKEREDCTEKCPRIAECKGKKNLIFFFYLLPPLVSSPLVRVFFFLYVGNSWSALFVWFLRRVSFFLVRELLGLLAALVRYSRAEGFFLV